MKSQQIFFFLYMGTLVINHNLIGMAAVEKAFAKLSVFQQKPYHEQPPIKRLHSYAYCSKIVDLFCKQLHNQTPPGDAGPFMFVSTSYQEVSAFLQELSHNSKAHILEFDCSKSDTLSVFEQNQLVHQLFEQASQIYDTTNEPVIIHFHHLEGGLTEGPAGTQFIGLHYEYDTLVNGDKNIILVSSTETLGEQLIRDFLDRHCITYIVKNKVVYEFGAQALFDAYNHQVKMYNYRAQAMNALVVAGGVVGSIVLLLVIKKKLQSSQVDEEGKEKK